METKSLYAVDLDDHVDASSGGSPRPERAESDALEVRINKFSKAILLALGIAVLMATVAGAGLGNSGESNGGPRLGGDFAAFYAAGSIVGSGDIDSLYDPDRQAEAQEDLGLDGYLAFAYPPHVALAYAPLGALSFQVAYMVHTVIMAAAFLLSVQLLRVPVPLVDRYRWPLLAASFTFYPLITAVGGGQNASLSVLLLAVVWRGLHDGRDAIAGLAIGLLAFRPQYCLPMLGLVFLAKHWRAVAAAIATIATTWLVTAFARGAGWLGEWWEQVGPFVERDAEVNAANSISLLGFFQAALSADSGLALVGGVALAAAVVATLMFLWANPSRFTLSQRMGAAAIGILLISPHTMFYDASLLLIAGAALLAESASVPVRVLAAVWAGVLLHSFSGDIGATPLALVVCIAFVAWIWHVVSTVEHDSYSKELLDA